MSYLKRQIEEQEIFYFDLIDDNCKPKIKYRKPEILAQGVTLMSECRPNSKPGGRPCNPPRPGGY